MRIRKSILSVVLITVFFVTGCCNDCNDMPANSDQDTGSEPRCQMAYIDSLPSRTDYYPFRDEYVRSEENFGIYYDDEDAVYYVKINGDREFQLRYNQEDFPDAGDSWVRPFANDGGVEDESSGQFVGENTSSFQWSETYTHAQRDSSGLIDNSGIQWTSNIDGNVRISAPNDTQFHLWTYLYNAGGKQASMPFVTNDQCVGRLFMDGAYSDPHLFWEAISLNPLEEKRIDITCYNQNSPYEFSTAFSLPEDVKMNSFGNETDGTSIQFDIPIWFNWGNWISIRREFLSMWNMAGCEGIRLKIKVIKPTSSALFRFTLADVSSEDIGLYGEDELWWSDHESVLTEVKDWTTIEIPFEDFYLSGDAAVRRNNSEFDKDKIIAYEFTIVTSAREIGHFIIKEVEVY